MRLSAQIDTDRPDFTESPNVVPKGAIQIESGFVMEGTFNDNFCLRHEQAQKITFNTTLIRFGVTDNFELRLNRNYEKTSFESQRQPFGLGCPDQPRYNVDTIIKHSGFTPMFVGFKTNLFKNDKVSLGFLGHLYLPFLSDEAFGNDHYTPEFLFPISIKLSDKFGISAQWSMRWDGSTARSTTGYTLSVAYAITDKLKSFVEPYGYITENKGEDHRINGGFTYLINDRIQADATGGLGLSSNAPKNFISCGLSVLIL